MPKEDDIYREGIREGERRLAEKLMRIKATHKSKEWEEDWKNFYEILNKYSKEE
jgi:hypothetical protein